MRSSLPRRLRSRCCSRLGGAPGGSALVGRGCHPGDHQQQLPASPHARVLLVLPRQTALTRARSRSSGGPPGIPAASDRRGRARRGGLLHVLFVSEVVQRVRTVDGVGGYEALPSGASAGRRRPARGYIPRRRRQSYTSEGCGPRAWGEEPSASAHMLDSLPEEHMQNCDLLKALLTRRAIQVARRGAGAARLPARPRHSTTSRRTCAPHAGQPLPRQQEHRWTSATASDGS